MRTAPKRHGPIRILLWIVYDLLWIGLGAGVYGLGLLAAFSVMRAAYGLWGWTGVAFTALPSYVLMLAVVVSIMALVRMLSPKVEPGIYEKFKPGPFFALVWLTGLYNMIFAMPFLRTVHFIAFLRYLFYRGMGMQTHYENWISPDVTIADPFMIRLGRGVNIGGRSSLSGHLALPDRMIIAPITLGDRVVVGAHAKLGPGVTIGDDALIGANSTLSVEVKVGEGAYVEPGSFVPSRTVIGPFERWGGHPAVHLGRSSLRRRPEDQAPAPEAAPSTSATEPGGPS